MELNAKGGESLIQTIALIGGIVLVVIGLVEIVMKRK